jgi:hypothetical protein
VPDWLRSATDRGGSRPGPARPRIHPARRCFKNLPTEYVRAAADAGQTDFGENRVQDALRKMDEAADLAIRWHLVGHLQSNKAKKAGRFE